MNYKDKIQAIRKFAKTGSKLLLAALVLGAGISLNSCQKNEDIVISKGEPAALSLSASDLVLTQREFSKSALTIFWTRGTNQGTGSSMSYTLQIDEAGNDFASAQTFDLGPAVYEKSYTVESLNDFVRSNWTVEDGVATDFETRVIVDVTMDSVEDDTTDVASFTVTPYKPVTSKLYIVGSATPNGWDISNATEMNKNSSSPWIFNYQGALSAGTFKFAVSQDGCWCQDFYTKDADDDEMMIYNEGGSGDDVQWNVEEGGNYKVTVDLLELKISIEKLAGPAFSNLYIVGDASPSGWNIGSPEAFTKNQDNPFIFTYQAVLVPGSFKISTFTGDWCDGQWINASQSDQVLTATDYIVTNGCDGPDNKWLVTEETQGMYTITVNLQNSTIAIEPFKLYMVGSATPVGWDISNAVELVQDATNWYIFTYTGPMVEGEFKFPVNRQSDWGQDMYMKDPSDPTKMYLHHGGDSDDEKWSLTADQAGDYVITVNVLDLTIDIQKQ